MKEKYQETDGGIQIRRGYDRQYIESENNQRRGRQRAGHELSRKVHLKDGVEKETKENLLN